MASPRCAALTCLRPKPGNSAFCKLHRNHGMKLYNRNAEYCLALTSSLHPCRNKRDIRMQGQSLGEACNIHISLPFNTAGYTGPRIQYIDYSTLASGLPRPHGGVTTTTTTPSTTTAERNERELEQQLGIQLRQLPPTTAASTTTRRRRPGWTTRRQTLNNPPPLQPLQPRNWRDIIDIIETFSPDSDTSSPPPPTTSSPPPPTTSSPPPPTTSSTLPPTTTSADSILKSMDRAIQRLEETINTIKTHRDEFSKASSPSRQLVVPALSPNILENYSILFRNRVEDITLDLDRFSSFSIKFNTEVEKYTRKQRRIQSLMENRPTVEIAEGDMCAICLSSIYETLPRPPPPSKPNRINPETLVQLKRCKHVYCKGCISDFLTANNHSISSTKCPQCRKHAL
jgi:hypothetical protein